MEECDYSKLRNFISSRSDSGAFYSIPLISTLEVSKIFKSLASNKASGHDGLSPRILKVCSSHLFYPLYKLINLSIVNSVFPSSWKIADVIPIHKSGPCDDPNNYRTVSILPVLSKIIERHVAKSLLAFLQDSNLLYRAQSGFRPNHSTETALTKITDNLLFNIDKDNTSGLVFLDFKKAFDLVNHKVLLDMIGLYGGTVETVKLFESYLSDRRQCVKVNGLKSVKQVCLKDQLSGRFYLFSSSTICH